MISGKEIWDTKLLNINNKFIWQKEERGLASREKHVPTRLKRDWRLRGLCWKPGGTKRRSK